MKKAILFITLPIIFLCISQTDWPIKGGKGDSVEFTEKIEVRILNDTGDSTISFGDASAVDRGLIYFDHDSSPEGIKFSAGASSDIMSIKTTGDVSVDTGDLDVTTGKVRTETTSGTNGIDFIVVPGTDEDSYQIFSDWYPDGNNDDTSLLALCTLSKTNAASIGGSYWLSTVNAVGVAGSVCTQAPHYYVGTTNSYGSPSPPTMNWFAVSTTVPCRYQLRITNPNTISRLACFLIKGTRRGKTKWYNN